jgi:glycosyltransferase involved in cell wall biosynthesis
LAKFSVIVPVYNRPFEMQGLLKSLSLQMLKDFEVIVVEDGSDHKSDSVIESFKDQLTIKYFFKNNSGPGDSRNFGIEQASGDYLIFFDSDCIVPKEYFLVLDREQNKRKLDAFGGPDNAHESFSETQKAINYAMTSFFTTGGIRGGKRQLDKFQPRSFNMGMSREVYNKVGGFGDIHPGEDPDLSYRIMDAGFKVGLITEAFVYHKRRIDFNKFTTQVYKFGVVRVILNKWHPKRKSLVFYLPSVFLICSFVLILGSAYTLSILGLFPLGLFALLLMIDSLRLTRSISISLKAVYASFLQLYAYGFGFLKSLIQIWIMNRAERIAFPSFFFIKKP